MQYEIIRLLYITLLKVQVYILQYNTQTIRNPTQSSGIQTTIQYADLLYITLLKVQVYRLQYYTTLYYMMYNNLYVILLYSLTIQYEIIQRTVRNLTQSSGIHTTYNTQTLFEVRSTYSSKEFSQVPQVHLLITEASPYSKFRFLK